MPVVRSFFLNSSTKISDNFSPPEGKINENRDNKDSERFTDFTRVTFTVLKGLKIEKWIFEQYDTTKFFGKNIWYLNDYFWSKLFTLSIKLFFISSWFQPFSGTSNLEWNFWLHRFFPRVVRWVSNWSDSRIGFWIVIRFGNNFSRQRGSILSMNNFDFLRRFWKLIL